MTNKHRDEQWHKFKEQFVPASTPKKATPTPPKSTFEISVDKTFLDAKTLLLRKHKDYGPLNIAHAPGGAMNGLMVRMHDKMERLKHLTYAVPDQKPNYESIEDTLMDLANYAIIGLLVQRGQWEGIE